MASPPFSINEALPADDDIVSQHPTNARAFRDTVESWLLINHNVNGRHDEVALDFKADPSAPGASINEIWASSTGNAAGALKQRSGASGAVEYVGVPPGTVVFTARSSVDEGWLACAGAAVSRTTYARLFDAIGTTYGVGDGSTTFNLPDITGRVIAGKETAGSRLTTAGSGVDGGTLGATGGAQTVTLARTDLPNTTISIPSGQGGHTHDAKYSLRGDLQDGGASGAVLSLSSSGTSTGTAAAVSNTLPAMATESMNGGVTQTAVNKVQPTIVLLAQIKT